MKKIRKVLYLLGFLSGICSFTQKSLLRAFFADMDFSNPIIVGFFSFSLIMVLLFPYCGLLFILGLQSINPFSAERWIKPSHETNPLNLKQPLFFFHFASYIALFYSIGILLSSSWNGWLALVEGALNVIISINMIFALKLCQIIFKKKFESI